MTRVELSALVPDPDNANEHPDENIAAIHASLLEFGQVDPLIVQKESRRVIAGNARLLVMQSMGMTHANVIERAVRLWTNPKDLVLSPFTGIGSEGYVALQEGRRFVGFELKRAYYDVACKNLEHAVAVKNRQGDLFAAAVQS